MAYKMFSDADNESARGPADSEDLEPVPVSQGKIESAALSRKPGSAKGWLTGWRGLAIGLGLGAAIATVGTHLSPGSRAPEAAPTPVAAAPSQSVTVAPAQITAVTQTINVTGSVAAFDMLPILAEATGLQIQQVLAEEGQTVEAGQVLAVLNSSVLKAQLNQAKADVASAQAVVRQKQATLEQEKATQAQAVSELKRYQELAQAGAVSQKELVSYATAAKTAGESVSVAEANIASAEADVQSKIAEAQKLETQIGQTLVRAPSKGVIAEKVARVGNVTGTDKLFSLIRDGSLELQAKVPETELPQVNIGALASISSDADRRIHLQGQVREIAPLVDSQTRQATVKINLPASPFLRSGMFLRAAIAVQTAQALTVPAATVLPQPDGRSIVYVLEGADIVRARPIEIGARQGESTDPAKARIIVKSGLNVGDRVVVAGAGYVKDGDRVTVIQN